MGNVQVTALVACYAIKIGGDVVVEYVTIGRVFNPDAIEGIPIR